jgi:hypothetical protein
VRRAAGEALDGAGGAVVGAFGDGVVHVCQHCGELGGRVGSQAVAHLLVGQLAVGDGSAGDLGEDGGVVAVAQRLRPGDDQVGVRGLRLGQRVDGDGGDVVGVDESDAALAGCRSDGAVCSNGPGRARGRL